MSKQRLPAVPTTFAQNKFFDRCFFSFRFVVSFWKFLKFITFPRPQPTIN